MPCLRVLHGQSILGKGGVHTNKALQSGQHVTLANISPSQFLVLHKYRRRHTCSGKIEVYDAFTAQTLSHTFGYTSVQVACLHDVDLVCRPLIEPGLQRCGVTVRAVVQSLWPQLRIRPQTPGHFFLPKAVQAPFPLVQHVRQHGHRPGEGLAHGDDELQPGGGTPKLGGKLSAVPHDVGACFVRDHGTAGVDVLLHGQRGGYILLRGGW